MSDRRLRLHLVVRCVHKAKVYVETDATLFYESDLKQAQEIAQISGKPVLCTANMSMQLPGGMNLATTIRNARWWLRGPLGRAKGWLRHQLRAPMSSTTEP